MSAVFIGAGLPRTFFFRSLRGATLAALIFATAVLLSGGLGDGSTSPTPLSIVTQPADLSVVENNPAEFAVEATGSGTLSHQWRRDGIDIPGETSATLSWQASLAHDGSKFRVVVANAAGSVTSADATLSVTAAPIAPQITTQPQGISVVAPATATFSVTATGTALVYQWQRDGAGIAPPGTR